MQALYSFFRYTGRLFLGCALFLLAVILSGLHEIPRSNEDWVTKKSRHWGTLLFWLHALPSMPPIVAFFIYSLPLPKWSTCWMTPIKIHNIAMGMLLLFCVMKSWINDRKYENLLQFDTSWLASLRTWYILDLF